MENEKYLKTIVIEKFLDDNLIEKEDVVIDESRINIFLNGNKAISMMCIPKDQDAHAVGFLMSENVISSVDDIEKIELSDGGLRVDVTAKIDEQSLENLYKEKTLVSGCGGGVTGNIASNVQVPFNQIAMKIKPMTILDEIKKFYDDSELYLLTGCVHKAIFYLED